MEGWKVNTLDTLRTWLQTYPNFSALANFQVDYTDKLPGSAGVFPDGLVEIKRSRDIMGNVTVTNQCNFGLYCVFEKAPGDDVGASVNADWVADFQLWVQEQSVRKLTPAFGDDRNKERITAQNGVLYAADGEGTAMYMVQLSVQYIKKYRKGDIGNA